MRVHVRRQWDQASQEFKPYGKTDAGIRTVPLAGWVMAELSEHCARNGVGPGELLFTTIAGKPLRRSQLSEMIQTVAVKAGVERAASVGSIHFHDCRHTYASTLTRAGLNPKQIQTYLGHAWITETFDSYGHLFPSDEEAARKALDSLNPRRSDVSVRGLPAEHGTSK
jgi:integrase